METVEVARNVLTNFIMKMNEWEMRCYPLLSADDSENIKVVLKDELDDIFNKFCTVKERKQGRQTSLSCSEPPEYSPGEEVLSSEINKNKAIFVTQQHTGFKNKYRYTLHLKNDEWRIDKKEWLDDDNGIEKWKQCCL
ncbi:hypothetical protein SL013_002256 [Serratia marcescens]|nr:hypothetical protein [Serratia marcescens]